MFKISPFYFGGSSTHYGREFVLGFTAQARSVFHSGYNEISISSPFDTYINISLHKLKSRNPILKNKYLKAGNVLKYKISTSMRMHSTMVDNLGISVTATKNVEVSCLNQGRFTADSYLALPKTGLGRKYVVASYKQTSLGIISAQDSTIVYLILNITGFLRHKNRSYKKGEKIKIKLNKLETFHLDENFDLSGTIIEANKPIAVLSGNRCAKINTLYCDHLVEFLLPARHWGNKFVVATTGTSMKSFGDIFRVFAYENATRVRSKDREQILNSGEFKEYDMESQLSSFFECSKPCQVVQYTKGYLNKRGKGVDSSMLIVPSVDKFLNTYKVFLSGLQTNLYQHSITILIKSAEKYGLELNGKKASGIVWRNVEGAEYSWTIIEISNATKVSHVSRNVYFGVLVFGEGDFQSHGYPAGVDFMRSKLGMYFTKTANGVVYYRAFVPSICFEEPMRCMLGSTPIIETCIGGERYFQMHEELECLNDV